MPARKHGQNTKATNHDISGYTDKDVENAYYAKIKMANDVETVETLLQVDLYKNELNTIVEEAR